MAEERAERLNLTQPQQPATPYSDSITRPDCPKCGTRMMLARIHPVIGKPHQDERIFECPNCGNEITEIARFE